MSKSRIKKIKTGAPVPSKEKVQKMLEASATVEASEKEKKRKAEQLALKRYRERVSNEKKQITTKVNPSKYKRVRQYAVEQDKTFVDLLDEALDMLLDKYDKESIK